jgi:arylsulfatase A-like enzyme
MAIWRGTRLGHIAARRRERERTTDDALVSLSLVLAGIPALGAALAAGYWLAYALLAGRKHVGLMLAAAMGIALAALIVAALMALLLGRAVEIGLRALADRPGWARVLTAPRAPILAGGMLLAAFALAAILKTWGTLSLLPLRPLWIALVACALYPPSLAIARRLLGRISGLRPLLRRGALAAAMILLFLLALVAGNAEGPREAAAAHSGAGAALARLLRRMGDLDRDGYSRLLGGGDCDDGDPAVHPGAREIPDDGIDNNCIGGDATVRPQPPAPFAPVPPSIPPDLDVLLITIDTLRADHVGAYGYRRATTPRLDRLAAGGAVFENAWAHAPSTRYSIPAILTGRYPLAVEYVDIPREWPGISKSHTTIAEVMKERGLATSAILNYWYFDKKRSFDQGFDHYDNTNKRLHRSIPGEGPARTSGTSSREQTDAAIAEVDRLASGGRFFLWVHYYDPHMDYERHPGTKTFGSSRMDLYDHEIRFTDDQIARLLDHLDQIGIAERTAVVVTGDHGEGFGEHGVDFHGYHLYAPQTRVPLIIRVPGLAPRRIALPAGHIDILPTLANLVGARPVAGSMGRSLLDVLAGAPGPPDRQVFQQLSYENHHEMRAAASRRCHVIYNVSPDSSWEVYAIDKDPGETHDMSGAPGACAGSVDALAAWYDQTEIPAGAGEALLAERPVIARPLDVDFDSARLLEVAGLDQPVRAGGSIPMTFTFESRGAPLAGGWKVFVHLERVGPGARRFQGDHEPPRPLSWWRAGQFIRYSHGVPVPPGTPPGRYEVWVGLFRGSERHPARSTRTRVLDDRALAGTVDVER